MTRRRAERLTGCEVRVLEPGRKEWVCLGLFNQEKLVLKAEHRYEEVVLEKLVEMLYALNCRLVLKRHGWRCARCHSGTRLQIHHRQYRSHGGTHAVENLEPVCWKCHRLIHKYEKSQGR